MDRRRRNIIKGSIAAAAASITGVPTGFLGIVRQDAVPANFPQQDVGSVRSVVGMSHFNLEGVTELVTARPELAKASWDWGYGDWETALGAASHTGNHAIAELLVANGAPPTLYSATVLGQLDTVRTMIETSPGIQGQPGPHGIPLLTHARLGEDRAKSVYEYLQRVGGADTSTEPAPFVDAEREAFFGAYRFGLGADEYLEGYDQRGALMLRRGEGTGRGLTHMGGNTFYPAGAKSVRIVFVVDDGTPVRVTVHDPDPIVTATRES